MFFTVFLTVFSGVIIYVLGQLIVKLLIDPVQEMNKTIGQISHSLIEYANVIANPGISSKEVMHQTSQHLRQLSSQLQAHLYLIPKYDKTAKTFHLPVRGKILAASGSLIALSNSVFSTSDGIHKHNAQRVENVCDSLGIYLSEDNRWPKENHS